MEHLSHAERKVLEALTADDVRYRSGYRIMQDTGLDRRGTITAVKGLLGRDLIAPRVRGQHDPWRGEFAATTLGATELANADQLQLRTA